MENLVDCKDVASRIKVTESAVRTWVRLGKIPFLKVNGALRFDLSEIDAWIKLQNEKPPKSE